MTLYEKARTNARQFKAVTSLSIEKFDILLSTFEAKWSDFIEKYNLDGTARMRKYVPKNEVQLPTVAEKLFFILYYKKNNSLQESLALQFDLETSMANKWIHILTPILTKTLQKYIPKTNLEDVDFQIDESYIIDGTEYPIQRDTYDQETFYSGKKKMHTLKNALIVSTLGIVMWLGKTHVGKIHDKPMVESLKFKAHITLLADLGFKGWNPANTKLILPHKKPRNTKTEKKELLKEQKDFNKEQSKQRVIVENVIAHIKVLRIIKDKNRNYKSGFRENLMKTACGLHNFRKTA